MKPDRIKVTAHIRKNETGEVRPYLTDLPVDDGVVDPFIWQEGNFSCDCNRDIFFEGNQDEDDDMPCSNTIYSVNLENAETGEIFYREY